MYASCTCAGKNWDPSPEERIEVYYRLTTYFKEHFGSDDYARRHTFYFLPWHFAFFCRYRPLPEESFRATSREYPLIQDSRRLESMLIEHGLLSAHDTPAFLCNKLLDSPLERLLRCDSEAAHLAIASALWDAKDLDEAVKAISLLADTRLEELSGGTAASASAYGEKISYSNKTPKPGSASSKVDNDGEGDGSDDTLEDDKFDENSWAEGGGGPRGRKKAPPAPKEQKEESNV